MTQHILTGALTDVYTTDEVGVGAQYRDAKTGARYVFVKNSGATSWTIGVPVGIFLTADTLWECSFTAATQLLANDGTTNVTVVAGIALGTVATTEFGWIQVGGISKNLVTDGTLEASCAGYVADNGVAVIISTEPTAHGICCVGIDNDVGNLSSNALLTGCVLDF